MMILSGPCISNIMFPESFGGSDLMFDSSFKAKLVPSCFYR